MRSVPTVTALASLLFTALAIAPPIMAGFNLNWTETFTGNSVNTDNWACWTSTPSKGEQEIYPGRGINCQITASSSLLIVPENTNGQWTSCNLESHETWAAKPGKKLLVQASLKLGQPGAQLQGIWPAFWSLGAGIRN